MQAKGLITVGVAGVLSTAAATGTAYAAYTGPTDEPALNSVQNIMEDGVDDQSFILTGNIMKRVAKETYIFQDSTGSIRAEIDDRLFDNVQVNEKTHVELRGEVERDLIGAPEIDVKILRILPEPQ